MITSTPIKYFGGKHYLAKWLHSLAPASVIDDPLNGYTHRNITFAGGLGELYSWQPVDGISEAINDTNRELTTFYAVLRSPEWFPEFQRRVSLMPFSDGAFGVAATESETYRQISGYCVDVAASFFIRCRQSRMGMGKDYATPTTRVRRGMNENVSAWLSAVDGLAECHERLRRVEIRNMDCIAFIKQYDHPRALFYLDPPYLHVTRSSKGEYGPHEMTEADHIKLCSHLCTIEGKFMLSGYPSEQYDYWARVGGWRCVTKEIDNHASSAKIKETKTECVWMNF